MTREIKFRAIGINSGRWVCRSLATHSKPETTPDIYDAETSQFIAVKRGPRGNRRVSGTREAWIFTKAT